MYQKVDDKLWQVQMYLAKSMSFDEAERTVYPLRWYVNTGRASVPFLKALLSAKTYMVARKLSVGGSVDECIARVRKHLVIESEVTQ